MDIKLDTNIKTKNKSRAAAIASKNKTKSLYDSELCQLINQQINELIINIIVYYYN